VGSMAVGTAGSMAVGAARTAGTADAYLTYTNSC